MRVVPDVPAVHRAFDYRVPPSMAASVAVGTEVRVVLHGRRVRGWAEAVGVDPPPGVQLRPIAAVRGVGPPPGVLDLAAWAAWRWAGTRVTLLRTASSGTVVRQLPPTPTPSRRRTVVSASAGLPARGGVAPGAVAPGGQGPSWPDGPEALTEALAGGTTVVRLAPAADRRPLLRALSSCLDRPGAAAGAGILVLVPEVEDVAPAAAQLRAAGLAVASLPADWARARAGGCAVVGTRTAAWAPLPALAAAVVLDAHDPAYVEQRAPTWSAWAVVAERARRDGAPCLLVSPCPTLDLLAAGRLVVAPRQRERAGWPPVEVVDLRAGDPRHGLLSPRVAELGRWAVAEPGRRVAMVVNRTGGARLVACAACGDIARCSRCRGPMELVEEPERRLSCRRCGDGRPVVCARCGSTATRALRLGVKRLQRDLQALVGAPVVEVTAATRAAVDGAGGPGADPARAPLVVGTEAALRGAGTLDAVVLLDVDGELLAPRLRAGEEVLAQVARAARRLRRSQLPATAGRSPGRIVIQTRQPAHAVVRAAVAGDPSVLTDDELPLRQVLRLPPAAALAQLSGPGAEAMAASLRVILDGRRPGGPVAPGAHAGAGDPGGGAALELDGPADGVWTLRAPDHASLADLLAAVPRPGERVRVDVDPVDL